MNELRLTDREPKLWARVPRQRRSCTRYWRLPGSRANLVVRWIAKNLRASVSSDTDALSDEGRGIVRIRPPSRRAAPRCRPAKRGGAVGGNCTRGPTFPNFLASSFPRCLHGG